MGGRFGAAIDELRDGACSANVCLVGLRLGATLAVLAGAERGDVEHMILWEPVLHGPDYIDELKAHHRDRLRRSFAHLPAGGGNDGVVEVLGFPLTRPMSATIERVDLTRLEAKPANGILLLGNSEESGLRPLLEHYRDLGIQADHLFVPAPPVWRETRTDADAPLGACSVPSNVLNAAVAWLTKVSV